MSDTELVEVGIWDTELVEVWIWDTEPVYLKHVGRPACLAQSGRLVEVGISDIELVEVYIELVSPSA